MLNANSFPQRTLHRDKQLQLKLFSSSPSGLRIICIFDNKGEPNLNPKKEKCIEISQFTTASIDSSVHALITFFFDYILLPVVAINVSMQILNKHSLF